MYKSKQNNSNFNSTAATELELSSYSLYSLNFIYFNEEKKRALGKGWFGGYMLCCQTHFNYDYFVLQIAI